MFPTLKGIKPGDVIKVENILLECVAMKYGMSIEDGVLRRSNVSNNDFTNLDEGSTEMKMIIATAAGVKIAIPYCEANLNHMMNAKIVDIETVYYPATEEKITLTEKQVSVQVINADKIRPASMSSANIRKELIERKAKLEAEMNALDKELGTS